MSKQSYAPAFLSLHPCVHSFSVPVCSLSLLMLSSDYFTTHHVKKHTALIRNGTLKSGQFLSWLSALVCGILRNLIQYIWPCSLRDVVHQKHLCLNSCLRRSQQQQQQQQQHHTNQTNTFRHRDSTAGAVPLNSERSMWKCFPAPSCGLLAFQPWQPALGRVPLNFCILNFTSRTAAREDAVSGGEEVPRRLISPCA